ncbi:hypothetical protein SPONN_2367 [uncultured Candidatus Thioglobus sp.]|nr:hypothetical protein SPONN_2367 [uncultured Candidatus Thioglobus sp.]
MSYCPLVRNVLLLCCVPTYNICRNILVNYGLWDQLRIDHGREWYLMIFIQQKLAHFRNNVDKQPFLQTSSKKVNLSTGRGFPLLSLDWEGPVIVVVALGGASIILAHMWRRGLAMKVYFYKPHSVLHSAPPPPLCCPWTAHLWLCGGCTISLCFALRIILLSVCGLKLTQG